MSFSFEISENLKKVLNKLAKKDRALALAIRKKIAQIVNSNHYEIGHFKNLRGDMSNMKRVHIGSFVLVFNVNKDNIMFESLKHHDTAYKR